MAAPTASHWVVVFPLTDSPQAIFKPLVDSLKESGDVAKASPFRVPSTMKVGTLDSLMKLADDLGRADSFCEGVVRKTERQVAESHAAYELAQAARAGAGADGSKPVVEPYKFTIGAEPVASFVERWSWDAAQFDSRDPLPELVRAISGAAERVEADMRALASLYNEKKTALVALERKRGGNLMTQSLDYVLTEAALRAAGADFIPESWEYTCTQVLVFPKAAEEAFLESYEFTAPEVPFGPPGARESVHGSPVVPGSARRIVEDKDGYVLYTVAVLKKYVDAFRHACREKRYTVRDHVYDPTAAERNSKAVADLQVEVAGALAHLREQSRSKYAEAVSLWLHMKDVRAFTESVLRFGLPPGYGTGKPSCAAALVVPAVGAHGPAARKAVLKLINDAWASGPGAKRAGAAATGGDASADAFTGAADDPVIPGVTEGGAGAASAFPFILLEMDFRPDTSSVGK